MSIKKKLYHLVEKGSYGSKINLVFDYFIMALILLNVAALIVETMSDVNDQLIWYLDGFEIFSVIVFTLEYLVRIFVSSLSHPSKNLFRSALLFVFSFYGLIDLMAILPFYLPFLIPIDLRFLRILRLMRFMRVFKFTRYNRSIQLIWQVVKEKRGELSIILVVMVLVLIIASFLMHYAEGQVQPDLFPDIPSCFWWAVVTLTTVGYGDVVPVTTLGKVISGMLAFVGLALFAMPAGILSAGFIEKIRARKTHPHKSTTCPHCGKKID